MSETKCPQAWHAGIRVGVLRDCQYTAGHRGWHRNETGSLAWGGKLTADEHRLAAELRDEATP